MLDVRSPVGYRLRITVTIAEVEPGRLIAAVSDGDLAGSGSVRLAADEDGDETIVRIRWSVATTRPWMNRTAPVLAPVFRLAHALVMRRGERAASDAVRAAAAARDSEVRNAVNPHPGAGERTDGH